MDAWIYNLQLSAYLRERLLKYASGKVRVYEYAIGLCCKRC
jgi:hypothetical protein